MRSIATKISGQRDGVGRPDPLGVRMFAVGILCTTLCSAPWFRASSLASAQDTAETSKHNTAERSALIAFAVLRRDGISNEDLRAALMPAIRATQDCLTAGAQHNGSRELGRLNMVRHNANIRIALSPSGQAATLGTAAQLLLACIADHFRTTQDGNHGMAANGAADMSVTLRVQVIVPSSTRGVAALARRSTTGLAGTHGALLPWLSGLADDEPRSVTSARHPGGSLERATLETQLASYREEVRDCFRQHLRADRQSPASFEVAFAIRATGEIENARVVRDQDVSPVSACVVERMHSWHLGPPVGGSVEVRHTFTADLR